MSVLPSYIHESWAECPAFNLLEELGSKLPMTGIAPTNEKIFKAFRMPLDNVRVIVIGQDPYSNLRDATGIAMAIPDPNRPFSNWPPTLKIICEHLGKIYNLDRPQDYLIPDLSMWESQGVLLLNVGLTCILGQSGSHYDTWLPFTKQLVTWLDENNNGLIFYLLGKKQERSLKRCITPIKNYLFSSSHPAYAAREEDVSLFDGKFKEIATVYEDMYDAPLDWVLPF